MTKVVDMLPPLRDETLCPHCGSDQFRFEGRAPRVVVYCLHCAKPVARLERKAAGPIEAIESRPD